MDDTQRNTPHADGESLLVGVRICLVFEHSLSHYTRLLQEVAALREAGAHVELLTSWKECEPPFDHSNRTVAPLDPAVIVDLPASALGPRLLRIADNLLRNTARRLASLFLRRSARRERVKALRLLAERTDIFWVIDYPSLPLVLQVAKTNDRKVVYETVDLVPEYHYTGRRSRSRSLKGERRALPEVDGFITACDSYADYYMETYGSTVLKRRPTVRDNAPTHVATAVRPAGRPLRFLFLGSLMFDRPVAELIESMRHVEGDVTLTLQGKNYLGEVPSRLIAELGLADRVEVLPPCPPEEIVERAGGYDVGLVALRGVNENERRASTSKLFTYMAAGLVILGSNLPGVARVVRQHSNGTLVDGMGPSDWAEAISELASMPAPAIDTMKQRSLDAARLYAWEKQKSVYLAEFRRALGECLRESAAERGPSEPLPSERADTWSQLAPRGENQT